MNHIIPCQIKIREQTDVLISSGLLCLTRQNKPDKPELNNLDIFFTVIILIF